MWKHRGLGLDKFQSHFSTQNASLQLFAWFNMAAGLRFALQPTRRICDFLGARVRTRDQALQFCVQDVEQLPTHRLDDICLFHGRFAQLASNMLAFESCID